MCSEFLVQCSSSYSVCTKLKEKTTGLFGGSLQYQLATNHHEEFEIFVKVVENGSDYLTQISISNCT